MPAASPQKRPPRLNSRGAHTRGLLLDKALEAFSTRGFHGTSTRDIARAASMSPAAVYAHYATKEEILYHLSLDGHQSVQDALQRELDLHVEPAIRLRAAAAAFSRWHAEFHTQARVVQHELAALDPEHAAQIFALRRRTQQVFVDLVKAGQRAAVFDVSDPEMTAVSLTSLGIDVARWYRPGGRWTPLAIGEHHGRLALRMVGSRSP